MTYIDDAGKEMYSEQDLDDYESYVEECEVNKINPMTIDEWYSDKENSAEDYELENRRQDYHATELFNN